MNILQLARKTIEEYFNGKNFVPDNKIKQEYSKKQACFVTLTKNKNLRGCIGSLQASQPLWKDVTENALNAAFRDPRFLPLNKNELKEIKIEISVLSESKKLEYADDKDLLKKINHKMGLILKKGYSSSTFLPQVWEELPDKINFLEHLSMKAGLSKDSWKTAEFWYYNIESEKEK
jgi:AmmeMemoRadiSam system protein A